MRDPLGDALAAAAVAAGLDGAVLARIGGPLGEAAREAAAQLGALRDRERRVQRARWSVAARAPIPPGLRGVDPSWIEAALAALPARAREALAGNPQDPASVWLARWACAGFPPMPAIDPALVAPRTPADVVRLAPAALRAWLEDLGADELAFALGGAQTRELVGALASKGPALAPVAERLARALARAEPGPVPGFVAEPGPVPGFVARTDRRAAIARAKVDLDGQALLRIGARVVAPWLSFLDGHRIVLRLPRDLGRVLAEELRAGANIDHAR